MGFWEDARNDGPPGQLQRSPAQQAEQYLQQQRQQDTYLPWVDQLAQHVLLTAQALQRLHAAWDAKFTR